MISLAVFVPLVMATAGAVGLQCSTLIVRGLATGEVTPRRALRIFLAEMRTGVVIGILCGVLAGVTALFYLGDAVVGLSVGIAMITGLVMASALGTVSPFVCEKLNIDPAISAGPFITAFNDIISTANYLAVACLILYLF
jgi:magnesium transporter